MTSRTAALAFIIGPAIAGLVAFVASGALADRASEAYEHASHADHAMTPAVEEELRAKVANYRDAPDEYLMQSMMRMGPDYDWYLSENGLVGDVGILVLAHASGVEGDRKLEQSVEPLAREYPTALALGMAMMNSSHIQAAVDRLVAAGATEIAVVPVVATAHNALARQWEYIFGARDDAAYASVPRVTSTARLYLTEPMAAHPLVTDILLDHLKELSVDPANEVAFIVGHGPTDDTENEEELAIQRGHAAKIQERGGFADVLAFNLQDDAPPEIRAANVAELRAAVEAATADGKTALVAPFLMMTGRVQEKLYRDLAGLDFKFKNAGLISHPAFTTWIAQSVVAATSGEE